MRKFIRGQIVDIQQRRILPGEVEIVDGVISKLKPLKQAPGHFIMPGFIDAHIHIESSMVVPYEFAKIALQHGTVATVSDPHEIANVLGMAGVRYMIDNARKAKFKFHFGAPSCVPATSFETSGARLNVDDVHELLQSKDIYYLSEVMNYPGVLNGNEEVLAKLQSAQDIGKPIDGHAPGLRGDDARLYIANGISTDHESFTLEEALEKLSFGMKIIIREGSAACNYSALHPLIAANSSELMFCSDDKHPDDLMKGHINDLVKRSIHHGYDLFDVLSMACVNPVQHYRLPVGQLKPGDPADFILVRDLNDFEVLETHIDGECVMRGGKTILDEKKHRIVNLFGLKRPDEKNLRILGDGRQVPIIIAQDGEIITRKALSDLPVKNGIVQADLKNDVLKIAVYNRYRDALPAVGFIKGFGLKKGAMASSVAHDSHNIIAVGTNDADICRVVDMLVTSKGGLAVTGGSKEEHLPLPIAGLMSDRPCSEVAKKYTRLDMMAKSLGSTLSAPFMTLSFMALLVIPEIKISDKGIFDVDKFRLIDINVTNGE